MTFNFIETAECLATKGRLSARAEAHDLQLRLGAVGDGLRWQGMPPLVAGETGEALPEMALGRIAMGQPKRDGGGPVSELEAWMQAEVVAAGIAAAHETVTSEPVSEAKQEQLREAFARFALSQS